MKFKIGFLILLCIFAVSLSTQITRAGSIERLSAIKTGTPWDNKAVAVYNYLTNRAATAIIDISDSTAPVLCFVTDGNPLTWSLGLDVVDTMLYVNSFSDLWIGRLYPPDSIQFISFTDLPSYGGPEPWGIQVIDTVLYFADGSEGLYILNVKNSINPSVITFYDTPGRVMEFFILDSLIYLADYDSMIILNIKNPASPQYVGAVDIPRTCTDVHVVWPYAYATAFSSYLVGTDGSVKIIDVSTPSNPTIVGSINDIRGDPRAVYVNDDYIYVAARDWWSPRKKEGEGRADIEGGVRVAQGQVPDSLVISYDTPGNPNEIFVRGNLLLVPDSDSLQILYHNKTGIEEEKSINISLLSKFFVYPNPFYDKVTCEFQFQKSSHISLSVYDEAGRKVREIYRGPMIPGNVQFFWDSRDKNRNVVPTGEYFIRISAINGKYSESKKVIYLGGAK